jgi:hypothetical protein
MRTASPKARGRQAGTCSVQQPGHAITPAAVLSSLTCGTPFLYPYFRFNLYIPFQFLPPRGAVVCFLLWSSRLKRRHSPFGRRSNKMFRLLNLFSRPSDLENRCHPDSFPVGQPLRVLLVCLYLIHIILLLLLLLLLYLLFSKLVIVYSVKCCYSTLFSACSILLLLLNG